MGFDSVRSGCAGTARRLVVHVGLDGAVDICPACVLLQPEVCTSIDSLLACNLDSWKNGLCHKAVAGSRPSGSVQYRPALLY